MTEPVLTQDGQETLDFALNMLKPITREKHKQKYLYMVSLLMSKNSCKEAGPDLVTEAIKMVEKKPFHTYFHMKEDPHTFTQLFLDPYYDTEAYHRLPIQVKRWDSPQSEPNKPPEEMKVVAFCASPRQGGNNDVLIDEALRGAESAGASCEKFMLSRLSIKLCISCMKCKEPDFKRICALKDDLTETIYQKIIDSDAIVISFPIYSERASGQIAIFLDRLNCFTRGAKHDTKLVETLVNTGGTKIYEPNQIMKLLFSPLLDPGRRALVIGTWALPYIDGYDHIIENVIGKLNTTKIETVEALSVCGFVGKLHGLDEEGKAMILRYPKELKKAFLAGKSLVTGQKQ